MSHGYDKTYDRKGSYASSGGGGSSNRRNERSRSRSRSNSPADSDSDEDRYRSNNKDGTTHRRHQEYRKISHERRDNNDRTTYNNLDDIRKYAKSNDSRDIDNEQLCPPPPPRISKISFGSSAKVMPVKMKLAPPKSVEPPKKIAVAAVFSNNDSDEEVEEMPPECRMRMRNIGRDTPTSSGPNSFGKTKQGFCDAKKIFEKNMRDGFAD